ncbi:NAD(P)H-binding protein [Nannocystis radixulma]|uniref:NAD(P)H-binding protein n=1 Tax=Nannocystis radixulma TaxID=2995305 RepID=A0ABT5AY42_9BACT|nr:NAD(P)H-binding protein [Nannocystis radixulma]MDC0666767.1 NAD(P)H-binding protein [Nannocystis radixulma]
MDEATRTAILVGATGLVGRELLTQLLSDPRFSVVTVLTRRTCGVTHPKLVEHLVDFDRPDDWRARVTGDVLFSALGTTSKAAGSREAQYRVDYTYQLEVARAARGNGASTYVLVSSAGASAKSAIFYSRMKGELERDTAALGFPRARFLHPGPLDGDRQEERTGERWALRVLRPLAPILPATARPIDAGIVARAGIAAAFDPTPGVVRCSARDLFRAGAPK